jgi:2-polyprenyl-3-methyl-5-hydroxy-6-metoxy-1,4-benzoquinol methylase
MGTRLVASGMATPSTAQPARGRRIPGVRTLSIVRALGRQLDDRVSISMGEKLVRLGRSALLRPHRAETVEIEEADLPGIARPLVEDLVEFTGLAENTVRALLARRIETFRTEWFTTPRLLRVDEWFYLSSGFYLFANAAHGEEARGITQWARSLISPLNDALDFGGGIGTLSLALAGTGSAVDHLERSSVQKDFARFRVAHSTVKRQVTVLDWWQAPQRTYQAVFAIDVLEHLPDLQGTLESVLLRRVEPNGILVEASPFVRSVSNPMHHVHRDLEALMAKSGFAIVGQRGEFRAWSRDRITPRPES